MRKRTLNKLIRDEKGQALILVLILMLLGGLIIAPLLSYMSTGLQAGQLFEDKMYGFYAADSGIEDALWRIKNEELPLDPYDYDAPPYIYDLPQDINGNSVNVTIQNIWPIEGLEEYKHGTTPHRELVVVGDTINEETGEYHVEITYDGSFPGQLKIQRVGVWLPSGFDYVPNSASGITEDNPTDISDWRGGKALTWDFPNVKFEDLPEPPAPEPPEGGFEPATEYPVKRILTFNFSPAGKPVGAVSWIRTNRDDVYVSWDIGTGIYKVTSTATDTTTGKQLTVESYTMKAVLEKEEVTLQGDYRAIGQTLETYSGPPGPHPERDVLLPENSAAVSDIPDDAEVVWAYLYWSAMKEQSRHWEGGRWGHWVYDEMEADREVSFEVNGQPVYFNPQGEPVEGDQDIEASNWWLKENPVFSHTYSYSCFKDVTELVQAFSDLGDGDNHTGNGEYTVGGVDGTLNYETSYAGWSMIIVYSSPTEEYSHNLYLYDDFLYAGQYTNHIFTIIGFLAPADAEATVTCFVGEGDPQYGDHQAKDRWHSYDDDEDYIKFNENYLFELPVNPRYNVWNSESSGLGGEEISGVDIDTFAVSSPIINEGDTWADVEMGTGYDVWNLVYIILSFRSEVPGGLIPNTVGSITYTYAYGGG